MRLKSIETEAKTEMNNEWNTCFHQNTLLVYQYINSREFSTCLNTFETSFLIWCKVALSYYF